MQFMFKWFLLIILFLLGNGCVSTLNFDEGIANFRVENYRTAFIRLKPEAEKGQPDAQYAIAYMYYYGLGVIENRQQAWLWMNRSARAGQPQAIAAIKILTARPPRLERGPDIPGA